MIAAGSGYSHTDKSPLLTPVEAQPLQQITDRPTYLASLLYPLVRADMEAPDYIPGVGAGLSEVRQRDALYLPYIPSIHCELPLIHLIRCILPQVQHGCVSCHWVSSNPILPGWIVIQYH